MLVELGFLVGCQIFCGHSSTCLGGVSSIDGVFSGCYGFIDAVVENHAPCMFSSLDRIVHSNAGFCFVLVDLGEELVVSVWKSAMVLGECLSHGFL